MNKALAVTLIVLGLIGLIWGGFSFTTKEKVIDIGPVEATRDKQHNLPIPPIAGGIAVIAGVALLLVSRKG